MLTLRTRLQYLYSTIARYSDLVTHVAVLTLSSIYNNLKILFAAVVHKLLITCNGAVYSESIIDKTKAC